MIPKQFRRVALDTGYISQAELPRIWSQGCATSAAAQFAKRKSPCDKPPERGFIYSHRDWVTGRIYARWRVP
jgi:hypothetical protein